MGELIDEADLPDANLVNFEKSETWVTGSPGQIIAAMMTVKMSRTLRFSSVCVNNSEDNLRLFLFDFFLCVESLERKKRRI